MSIIPKKQKFGWKASMLYTQGAVGGNVQISLQCTDIPKGSIVSMSADETGPTPPIRLEPTVVSTYPTFTTGIMVAVPADYKSNINFEVKCTEKPPVGSNVSLIVAHMQPQQQGPPSQVGPVKVIVVAEVTVTNSI